MAVTFCSLSRDRFNALLIASVQGTEPACSTAYSFHTPSPFPHSPIRKPTIHFSQRFGMIIPQADWTHLSSPHTGSATRHAGRGTQKWTWYKHWGVYFRRTSAKQPVQSGSLSLWASSGAPAVLCSCICSSTKCKKGCVMLNTDQRMW